MAHNDPNFNWVEAIPGALRIHHDTVDPVMGISPYQAIFGRDRLVGGLPWAIEKECREATEFFDHMADLDREVAQKMNDFHEKWKRGSTKNT
jgi:hypothetical protein